MGDWVLKEVENEARDQLREIAIIVDDHKPNAEGCLNPITSQVDAAWQGDTPERIDFMHEIQDIKLQLGGFNNEVAAMIMEMRAAEPVSFWQFVEE